MKESVITDVEKPCFHALLIQYHGYRILLLLYAVLQIFVSPELDVTTRLRRLRETPWGRQLVLTSKTVLIEFIRFCEQPYASSLSHAPDHLFNLVCFVTLLLIKAKHMHGASQPYLLPTLMPLVQRVTGFLKGLALTEDHLPMRCAMLIETLMKAYEQMRASSAGDGDLDGPGESETPPTNDSRGWNQPGQSSQPPAFTDTPAPPSALTTGGGTTMESGGLGSNALPEPNPAQGLGIDGLMNLGGIEMFLSQSIWPENVLLGQVGESGGGEAAAFDFGDLFGLYDAQPQI